MLPRVKIVTVLLATAVAGIVVYQLAMAQPPQTEQLDPSTPQAVAPPALFPGWVPANVEVRVPMWVPEGFPKPQLLWPVPGQVRVIAPGWPYPPIGPLASPVDEGSLKAQKRLLPDGFGGHYLVEERTWTSQGVPHRQIITQTYLPEGSPLPESQDNLPQPAEQPDAAAEPVPAPATEQPATDEPAESEPVAPEAPEAAEAVEEVESPEEAEAVSPKEQPAPADELDLVPVPEGELEPEAAVAEAAPATVVEPRRTVGVGVSVDSRNGTRVWEYYEGAGAQPREKSLDRRVYIQTWPGIGRGVGVSVDPNHGTRVYYYGTAPN